jgi:hypothetical protein
VHQQATHQLTGAAARHAVQAGLRMLGTVGSVVGGIISMF